jgi:hypothetical protein
MGERASAAKPHLFPSTEGAQEQVDAAAGVSRKEHDRTAAGGRRWGVRRRTRPGRRRCSPTAPRSLPARRALGRSWRRTGAAQLTDEGAARLITEGGGEARPSPPAAASTTTPALLRLEHSIGRDLHLLPAAR